MSTTIPIGGASTTAVTVGATTAGTTLGVADGTGPLLQHVAGTTLTAAPLAGSAVGTTAKTAVAAKTLAIASTFGGVALFGLFAAAAAGVGYVGYRIFSGDLEPDEEESQRAVA